VVLRTRGLIITLCVVAAFGALFLFAGEFGDVSGGVRAVLAVIIVALVGGITRLLQVGVHLEPDGIVIRDLTSTERLRRAEVLGLAAQPVGANRFRRVAVVCTDGRVLPAVWAIARATNMQWAGQVAWAASGFGPTQPQVEPKLAEVGRLAAAEPLPVATSDPGLTP
jgi:hypothetical protein